MTGHYPFVVCLIKDNCYGESFCQTPLKMFWLGIKDDKVLFLLRKSVFQCILIHVALTFSIVVYI